MLISSTSDPIQRCGSLNFACLCTESVRNDGVNCANCVASIFPSQLSTLQAVSDGTCAQYHHCVDINRCSLAEDVQGCTQRGFPIDPVKVHFFHHFVTSDHSTERDILIVIPAYWNISWGQFCFCCWLEHSCGICCWFEYSCGICCWFEYSRGICLAFVHDFGFWRRRGKHKDRRWSTHHQDFVAKPRGSFGCQRCLHSTLI